MDAYVLVLTEMGRAAEVATALRGIDGVVRADMVTGPYDVVVTVRARDVVELGRGVLSAVQATPGITRTLTCPVVDLG